MPDTPAEHEPAVRTEPDSGSGPRQSTRRGLADRYHRTMDVLNVDRHQLCLRLYLVIVVAHWAEHIVQAAHTPEPPPEIVQPVASGEGS